MAKVGRPTIYKSEYCAKVIEFMSEGYSLEAFAGHIGHHKQTIYEWRDKHQGFGDAIKRGFDACRVFWERQGMNGLFTDKETKFNATVWIFNMKNRFGWRDQQSIELANKEGESFRISSEIENATDEELKERLKQILKGEK